MQDRFMNKVSPEPNSGCWLWVGGVDTSGYGQFGVWKQGKERKAHRISYEHHHGPIPKGMIVLHKCDVPCCVNPDHLRIGTHADNSADRNAKKRHAFGEKSGVAVLTEELVRYIRSSKKSERELSKEIGIPRPTIHFAKAGKTWRHVA